MSCEQPLKWNVEAVHEKPDPLQGSVQPGGEKTHGDLSSASKYLPGGCKEDRDRLLSEVSSNRTRHYGHKLNYRKFHLNMCSLNRLINQSINQSPNQPIPFP